jgi:hypothetical protein
MAERTKFRITICGECCVAFPVENCKIECRLNPPSMVTQYTAAYPVISFGHPACFAGVAGSAAYPPAPGVLKGKKGSK